MSECHVRNDRHNSPSLGKGQRQSSLVKARREPPSYCVVAIYYLHHFKTATLFIISTVNKSKSGLTVDINAKLLLLNSVYQNKVNTTVEEMRMCPKLLQTIVTWRLYSFNTLRFEAVILHKISAYNMKSFHRRHIHKPAILSTFYSDVFLRSPPGNQVTFQNGGQLPQYR